MSRLRAPGVSGEVVASRVASMKRSAGGGEVGWGGAVGLGGGAGGGWVASQWVGGRRVAEGK